jgi:DNA-binding XRE family transcriptional regulator
MNYWTPEQFRQARLDLGLTRVQLADALECNLRTVERCEAEGCRKVMALALERLARENQLTHIIKETM